jgi:hypothetical protein
MQRITHRLVDQFSVGFEDHRVIAIPAIAFGDGRKRLMALVNGSPKLRASMPESWGEEAERQWAETYRLACKLPPAPSFGPEIEYH